jgi:hypothetical protein
VPFRLIGSFGVRTRRAFFRSTASASISPAGVSASSALVTTTSRGMNARRLEHLIDRRFSARSAIRTEMIGRDDIGKRARRSAPAAGYQRDKQAAVAIPEHGVAAIKQRGILALARATKSTTTVALSAEPRYSTGPS